MSFDVGGVGVAPAHRPYLARGIAPAAIAPDYRGRDVEVLLETAVTAVDVGARTVTIEWSPWLTGFGAGNSRAVPGGRWGAYRAAATSPPRRVLT